jgi:hypothetical protein
MASTTVIMIGSAVALPVGTPPKNGDVCIVDEVGDGAADEDDDAGAGACALTGTAAAISSSVGAKTDFTSCPFSPDAKLDERGAGSGRSRR